MKGTENMNSDIQRVLLLVMKKWKILFIFSVISLLLAFFYTANFVTLKYTSTVTFLAYVQDEEKDPEVVNGSVYATSNTSKMNYAIKMVDTYIALLQTNNFYSSVNQALNNKYGSNYIKNVTSYSTVDETAIFSAKVTTTDPAVSQLIAETLVDQVPKLINEANDGLVTARVVDAPIKASSSIQPNYLRNCIIGLFIGIVLAVAIILLNDILNIKIGSEDELAEKYDIPVLGAVPSFDITGKSQSSSSGMKKKRGKENG